MAIDKSSIDTSKFPDADDIKANLKISEYLGHPLSELKLIHSPIRADKNPSFSVFYSKKYGIELAKDLTSPAGQVYDVIGLHQAITGVTFKQACLELANWNGEAVSVVRPVTACRKTKPASSKENAAWSSNIGARSDTPVSDSNYIRSNSLEMPGWVQESLDAYTDALGNLCFSTVTGSVHVKGGKKRDGHTFTSWIGTGSYSVCGVQSAKNIYIYEGIGDFLAMITEWSDPSDSFYIILNSTSNIPAMFRDMGFKDDMRINLCLDQDSPGDVATVKIMTVIPFATDARPFLIYGDGCKDILDVYQAAA